MAGGGDVGQRLGVRLRGVRGGDPTPGGRQIFVRAGSPQTNGAVERAQRTILEECWKPAFARSLIPKYTGLRWDLERYLGYDNSDRAHTGRWTRGRTPEEVLGKVKMWSC